MELNLIKFSEHVSGKVTEARIAVAVFFTVGTIGMLIPFSSPVFKEMIPLALLLTAAILVLFHQGNAYGKTALFFLGVFLLSFFIEVAGVNSGLIFGEYHYGTSLGKQWLHTPLMIGVNWCLLIYMTASVTEPPKLNLLLKAVLAAFLMLLYDLVLEQVAPKTGMWFWAGDRIPVQNYAAWFMIALFFHSLLKIFMIPVKNKLAFTLLVSHFLFFCTLALFL